MSVIHLCWVDTPLGPYFLQETDGRLTEVQPAPQMAPVLLPHLPGEEYSPWPVLQAAACQLEEYFAGTRTAFELPLQPQGTDFQQQVWDAMARIPYGQTVSYAQLAAAIGRPGAARAVGAACRRNPLHILLPCHRVVGANGQLTGYAGGLQRKAFLLALEQRHTAAGKCPAQQPTAPT